MSYLIVLLSFLFLTGQVDPEERILSVTAEGSVELPADVIQFNINLNAEEETPEAAYRAHKRLEEALIRLLERYEIEEEDIRFEPVAISKSRIYDRSGPNERETVYQTRQMVSLTLDNFDNYEEIQIGLIEHGFDNFNGYFRTSRDEEGQDKALREAIREAKEKARLIADEANVKLGEIVSIDYRELQYRPYTRQPYAMMKAESSGGLMEYSQTVTITASVEIGFELIAGED